MRSPIPRPSKNKTPQRLTTRGAFQNSDESKLEISSTARSLYDTPRVCQETPLARILDTDLQSTRIFVKGICAPTNPGGYACWGWVMLAGPGQVIARAKGCAGKGAGMSNVVAEYHALIHALTWVRDHPTPVEVLTESRTLFNQLTGQWLCAQAHLLPLCEQAIDLLDHTHARLDLGRAHGNGDALDLCYQAFVQAARGGVP